MDIPPLPSELAGTSAFASDENLLRRVREGDTGALEQLYERYRRPAYALARRILGSPEAAEEVVQDAFLSIWRQATSYNILVGLVRPWLFTVVHHRAIDRLRRARGRHPTVSLDEAWMVPCDVDALREACREEQRDSIRLVLAMLPKEQREAIARAYFDGNSIAEIGQMTQAPVGTVKSRMRLGLARMRRLMDAEIAS